MYDDLTQIEEYWYPIEEFPDYEISNTGLVMNSNTGRIMKQSMNSTGVLKVGLMGDDGKQHSRSVKVLVAETFVEGRTAIFGTPIHLDCDPMNCNASNLVWRPRWFAYKYSIQFDRQTYGYNTGPSVVDPNTGRVYSSIKEAAMTHGLLMKDILLSCHQGPPCPPTKQIFKFLK